jgi:hypothetical protein
MNPAAALIIVLVGLSVSAQAADPTGTLTLACQGTATDKTDPSSGGKPEPVSMGLMIDFTSNTIAGFENLYPGVVGGAQVKIILIDPTSIGFSGISAVGGTVFGTVDRITGDVEAAAEFWSHETQPDKLVWGRRYSLKCKQRMF